MESSTQVIRTETKYEVTSCHFCNEFLDNNDFKSHLDRCGQVLQKCPNDCLAYIQRKFMEQHLLECPKKCRDLIEDDEYFVLEQNITLLRSALHEEIRQRHRLITDLGSLRKTFAEKSLESESFRIELNLLTAQYKEVKEWRKELRILLDKFYQDLEFRNEATLSFEILFNEKDKTIEKLQTLENEIDKLKTELEKPYNILTPKYENSIDSGTGSILSMGSSQSVRCQRCPFLEWKLGESLLELRQMKNIVYESEAKCDSAKIIAVETQKMCAHTGQELADLQIHLAAEKRLRSIENSEGHLIWRIDQYTAKLKDAKENDIILKSPIFCNKQYGYTLRLDVLLNGLGTWKGRNVLSCLNVVKGEWDALLPWPCKLKADIILRNQSDDLSSHRNISKTVYVKKQDANYEHNQYIFVSHRSIQSQQFLKNDCIFFEVIVHS